MPVLAAVVTMLAVYVAARTVLAPSRARVDQRLGRLRRTDAAGAADHRAAPFLHRVGAPLAAWAWARGGQLLPSSVAAAVDARLRMAGQPLTVALFWAWQLAMVLLGLVLLALALASGAAGTGRLMLLLLAGLLTVAPSVWLRGRIGDRRRAVLKALPDAVDLIVTTVEAGLGIDAALAEVAQETPGPLGQELSLAMREIALGRSRRDALTRLVERAPVPELRSFVQTLLQAFDTGIPVGQVLRAQAEEIRTRRLQRAEATANKAPVKMTLVLIFFVMPSMVLIMLGPAAIRMMDGLGPRG